MTQTERLHLERTAERHLENGRIEQSVAAYRRLGRRQVYVRKLRDHADASLREGDPTNAVAAYIAASCLGLPRRR